LRSASIKSAKSWLNQLSNSLRRCRPRFRTIPSFSLASLPAAVRPTLQERCSRSYTRLRPRLFWRQKGSNKGRQSRGMGFDKDLARTGRQEEWRNEAVLVSANWTSRSPSALTADEGGTCPLLRHGRTKRWAGCAFCCRHYSLASWTFARYPCSAIDWAGARWRDQPGLIWRLSSDVEVWAGYCSRTLCRRSGRSL